MARRINPSSLPSTLLLILIGALLIVALLPELRSTITGATNISGVAGTLLGYVPFILVAGVTLVIVYSFLGGGGRTRMVHIWKSITDFANFRFSPTKHRGITVASAIPLIVGLVIAFIIGVNIMEQLAYEISNATDAGGDLAGTLEATLLNLWVTIIVAGILVGTLAVFLTSGARSRFRGRGRNQ